MTKVKCLVCGNEWETSLEPGGERCRDCGSRAQAKAD